MTGPSENFIGRQTEIKLLGAALERARAGEGQLVLLAGEPGIGKTRTALELSRHAMDRNAAVFWGRCHEEAGAPPYWPWTQVLGAAAAIMDGDELRATLGLGATDIADILPQIRERLPDLGVPTALSDPDETRFRLFSSIARFLIACSRRRSAMLVLDDLHWADAPSLRFLEFLAQELADSRLLVIGAYRETELSRRHRLTDTLGALARVPHAQRLHLTGLSDCDVRQFVTTSVGKAPPVWLTSAIHDQTDGNPLFVREVVRFLAEQDYFATADAASATPVTIRLPEGVREVIGRRLNLLSAVCNDILALAAVIGREFTLAVLLRAHRERAEEEVLEALDEALTARIIEETSREHYQFTHTLVRITLYDELRTGQRRRLHHAVGQAIEAVHRRNLEPVLADLAHHFRSAGLAGDAERAADYATRAGERAHAALAFEDAVMFFQNAIDMLGASGTTDTARHGRLLFMLGQAQRKAGSHDRALESLGAAAGVARQLRDPYLLADVAQSYADVTYRCDRQIDAQSGQMLEEALAGLPSSETALRSQVMGALACDRLHTGNLNAARTLAAHAITLAREADDPAALASSLACLADFPWHPQETDRMLAEASEMVAVGQRANAPEPLQRGLFRRVALLLELGDMPASLAALDAMGRTNVRIRQPLFTVFEQALRATLVLQGGNLTEAERLILRLQDEARRRTYTAEPLSIMIFTLRREQGRLSHFVPLARLFADRNAGATIWRPGLALLYAECDELPAARAIFGELAQNEFASLPEDGRRAASLMYLAEACATLRDAAAAAVLHRLLSPWDGRNIVMGGGTGFWGSSGRYLGLLAHAMGEWEIATGHFDEALRMNKRVGANIQLAHTHHDCAAMMLARGRSGDAEGAAGHIEQAEKLADAHSLTLVARKIAILRRSLHETGAQTPPVPDNLTAREIEVLRLLAIGRTNADIALALGIGQSTVATHVHNILAKTGCDNRTEAAAYAVRCGLHLG